MEQSLFAGRDQPAFSCCLRVPWELTTSQGGVAVSPAARQVRRGFQNGRGQDGPLEARRACGGGWGTRD